MKTPGAWTLEQLFAGRQAALSLFHAIRQYIGSLGPVTVEVMKMQVSFGAKTKFAWVWLPQLWIKKTTRREYCPDLRSPAPDR
jgi:hypothetical protein